jgi:hypothetical protein
MGDFPGVAASTNARKVLLFPPPPARGFRRGSRVGDIVRVNPGGALAHATDLGIPGLAASSIPGLDASVPWPSSWGAVPGWALANVPTSLPSIPSIPDPTSLPGDAAAAAQGTIDAALAANSTPQANAAQIAGLASVVAKVANGGTMDQADVFAAVTGVCALASPALGAMAATAFALEMAFVAGLEFVFKELGWLASGSSWNPCKDPPKGPSDPKWVHADNAFWRLDGADMIDGTFQRFAVEVLRQNWENSQNCRPSYLDEWLLVQQLATAWNGAHAPPGVSFGLLGNPALPGYGLSPKKTSPASGDFAAATVQMDTLRVRGEILNGATVWSGDTRFGDPQRPIPMELKAMVINAGPSTVPPPPPPPPAPIIQPGQPGWRPGHL